MISDIQKSNDIPIIYSGDEKGGSVARIANSKICKRQSFRLWREIGKTETAKMHIM